MICTCTALSSTTRAAPDAWVHVCEFFYIPCFRLSEHTGDTYQGMEISSSKILLWVYT